MSDLSDDLLGLVKMLRSASREGRKVILRPGTVAGLVDRIGRWVDCVADQQALVIQTFEACECIALEEAQRPDADKHTARMIAARIRARRCAWQVKYGE